MLVCYLGFNILQVSLSTKVVGSDSCFISRGAGKLAQTPTNLFFFFKLLIFKYTAYNNFWYLVVYWQRVGGSWDGYWLTESLHNDGDVFSGGLAY